VWTHIHWVWEARFPEISCGKEVPAIDLRRAELYDFREKAVQTWPLRPFVSS